MSRDIHHKLEKINNIVTYLIILPIAISAIVIYIYYQYIMTTTDYVGPWILFVAAYILSGTIFYFIEKKKMTRY